MTQKAFDALGRLVDADRAAREPEVTGHAVRALYVLALLSMAVPASTSGWVRLRLGVGGTWASPLALVALAVFALLVWRIALVVRDRGRLDAPIERGIPSACRTVAIALMSIGVAMYVLQWLVVPIVSTLFPQGSDNDIKYFAFGLVFAMLAVAALIGLLLFEPSRLLGFEHSYRKPQP